MRFSALHSEREFDTLLHEDVRALAMTLDSILVKHLSWPELVITDVHRTREEHKRLYVQIGHRLITRLQAGEKLSEKDSETAGRLAVMSSDQIEQWAEGRFSWHLVGTAIDIRTTESVTGTLRYPERVTPEEEFVLCDHYQLCLEGHAPTRHDAIETWLKAKAKRPDWELVTELHGTGPHWHVARRDDSRRQPKLVRTT